MVEQALGRLRVGAQRRFAGAEDAGFLEADGLAVRTQPLGMVERHGGDDGDIGFVGVDRVEAPAEADLEDRRLDPGGGENFPCRQRAELEIGQRHTAGLLACRFDACESRTQRIVSYRLAVEAHSLVVGQQVR